MTRPGGYSASRFDVLCYSAYLIFKLFEWIEKGWCNLQRNKMARLC
jgi:hypothetical protein